MPKDVLGATNAKDIIVVRRDLPWYVLKHVIIHECEHIKYPYASEFEIETKARKKSGLDYIV